MQDVNARRTDGSSVGKQSFQNSLSAYDPQAYRDGAQAAIQRNMDDVIRDAFRDMSF